MAPVFGCSHELFETQLIKGRSKLNNKLDNLIETSPSTPVFEMEDSEDASGGLLCSLTCSVSCNGSCGTTKIG